MEINDECSYGLESKPTIYCGQGPKGVFAHCKADIYVHDITRKMILI